jgi:hypothetical protein
MLLWHICYSNDNDIFIVINALQINNCHFIILDVWLIESKFSSFFAESLWARLLYEIVQKMDSMFLRLRVLYQQAHQEAYLILSLHIPESSPPSCSLLSLSDVMPLPP